MCLWARVRKVGICCPSDLPLSLRYGPGCGAQGGKRSGSWEGTDGRLIAHDRERDGVCGVLVLNVTLCTPTGPPAVHGWI